MCHICIIAQNVNKYNLYHKKVKYATIIPKALFFVAKICETEQQNNIYNISNTKDRRTFYGSDKSTPSEI